MSTEQWNPVTGFEGLYEVSDHGRVRSLPRPAKRRARMYGGQVLKASLDPVTGYLRLTLHRGSQKHFRTVHQLVCEAFRGPRPDGQEVRHLNGVRTDNRASNLRWGTKSENNLDKRAHGTDPQLNRTHCPQGHPYEGENLYVDPDGGRECRACRRERTRAYKQRKAEAGAR